MSAEIITLKQAPIIVFEKIKTVGEEVKQRIDALALDSLVVTEDSKNAIKKTRAELNAEFETFEEQRKWIKNQVAKPYQEFEEAYKNFIAQNYKQADETLKEKITAFENLLKEEKENQIREYFLELCQSKNIDFLTFERLGLKVNLSTSVKSLKDSVLNFVEQVEKNLQLIASLNESEDFLAEALSQYKQTLDVNQAIADTQRRHLLREQERQRLEEAKRKQAEEEQQKQALQEAQKPLQAPEVVSEPMRQSDNEAVRKLTNQQTDQSEEELFITSFKVQGTKAQISALKQYIISNQIQILNNE